MIIRSCLMMTILITVAAVLLTVVMAKRRRSRWGPNDKNIPFLSNLNVGAPLDGIVVKGTTLAASDRSYRLLSFTTQWAMRGHTASEGPIMVGYAHNDYSVTEIKEALEAEAAMATGDKVANEQANRLVRLVGTFQGALTDEVLNDGKPIRTRLNWAIPLGGNVAVFAYNRSGATLTTGSVIVNSGKARIRFT